MDTYKNFLLKSKIVRLSQLHTQLQDTAGKKPVLSESCREAQGLVAGAQLRSPATEGQAPPGKGREAALSDGAAGRADAPAPRVLRAARKEVPASQPARAPRPPPLTAANLDSWPDLRSTPAAALAPGCHSPGSGGRAASLLPAATASGSGPAAGEHREPGEGATLSGRGTPEYRGAHSV